LNERDFGHRLRRIASMISLAYSEKKDRRSIDKIEQFGKNLRIGEKVEWTDEVKGLRLSGYFMLDDTG